MSFTHLQVRSGYSLMDSAITIDKLVEKATDLQFSALALTDEHVLYGAISFYKACKKHGIKPIIGMVVHIGDTDTTQESCVLLAKNNEGYRQLTLLSTYIGQHRNERIGMEELQLYTNDLICILPASNGALEALLLSETHDQAETYISKWRNMFDRGDFYLGVQDHGLEQERKIQVSLKAYQDTYQTPVVAINDVRYLNEKDASAYDCLQAMKNGKRWKLEISDPTVKQRHLRSSADMDELFGSFWPDVIKETEMIKDKCQVTFDLGNRLLPSFPVPEQLEAHTYLEKICWNNIEQKYEQVTEEIAARLSYELDVIHSMQFSDYFLIVWDFIAYAKKNNILVGPGRGSSASSIVAYVLGITDVDPIKYNLLFERFLNPERVTMPDIDIDFSDHRRDEVIDYVRDKYGTEHVAQIITFGTFAARSIIRELIKTIGIDQQDAYYILKEIPVQAGKSIVEYVNASPDFKNYIMQSPSLKVLFAVAAKLEGLPRHISTHAAGVVISERPLVDHTPLTIGSNETNLTQYPMNDLEAIGLLKMDFLGLRNLTLLERIMKTIRFVTNETIYLNEIPDNDEKTFALLQTGRTNGVFQLESQGMKQVLTRLKPTTFDDIVAVNALFRPGPMDYISVYVDRKHRRERTTYPHPDLAPILEKTYGVLIYQEQIMLIANKIAGFTLGQADILRRAVSKKKQDVMDEQKESFIQGCIQNGYDQRVAEEIFAWIVKFSNYGFPRSHAVAYSKISYQLAYLKAHYPASFFAELLSSVANQQAKVQLYLKEIRDMQLHAAAPSINRSFGRYTTENGTIRMGFLAIKGIGNQAVQEIIEKRKSGPFKNLFDFCLRISLKAVNRKTMESLILTGAFDEFHSNRASLLASIDQAMEQGELFREFSDQPSLFQEKIELEANYVEIEDFSQMKRLAEEKELLGIYISSHPLKDHRKALRANGYVSMKNAQKLVGKKNIHAAAIIQSIKTIRTKRGDPMAFITIGDDTGEMEAVIFPDVYRDVYRWLEEEMMVVLQGKVESRNNKIQWLISTLKPFVEEELQIKQTKRLFIKFSEQQNEHALKEIKKIADEYPGNTPIIVYHEGTKQTYQLAESYFVNPRYECLQAFNRNFGKDNVVLDK